MKFKKFILLIFTLICISTSVYAHPGNTDANGGHYDSYTGEYHYHHGFEAHYHDNGICPFGNIDVSRENVVTLEDYNNVIKENKNLEDQVETLSNAREAIALTNRELVSKNEQLSQSAKTSYIPYIVIGVILLIWYITYNYKSASLKIANEKVKKLTDENIDLNLKLKETIQSKNELWEEVNLLKAYDNPKIIEKHDKLANIFADWIPGDEVDYSKPLDRKSIYVKKSTPTKKYHRLDCKNASDKCTIVPIYDVPYFYKPCKLCKPQPLKTKKQLADELGLNQDDFDP